MPSSVSFQPPRQPIARVIWMSSWHRSRAKTRSWSKKTIQMARWDGSMRREQRNQRRANTRTTVLRWQRWKSWENEDSRVFSSRWKRSKRAKQRRRQSKIKIRSKSKRKKMLAKNLSQSHNYLSTSVSLCPRYTCQILTRTLKKTTKTSSLLVLA